MGIGLCHHVEDRVDRSERGSCGGRVRETAFFVVLFVAEECWEEVGGGGGGGGREKGGRGGEGEGLVHFFCFCFLFFA